MSIVVGLSMGAPGANAGRIVTANETTGLAHDLSSLSDSVFGSLCSAVNEDATACFATPYTVNSTFISAAFQITGGAAAVNLQDPLGSDTPGNLSDELYLTVSAPDHASGLYTLTWCWDSDLEPNQNICPVPNGITPVNVVEPLFGFTDLTSSFTGQNGPLAAGQWTILAQSEAAPEPASLFLLGGGLAVGALCLWKRRGFRVNDLPEAPRQNH